MGGLGMIMDSGSRISTGGNTRVVIAVVDAAGAEVAAFELGTGEI
jgi:hypothetical protein